jgi:tetratricopeptide (TPR) repeat protein
METKVNEIKKRILIAEKNKMSCTVIELTKKYMMQQPDNSYFLFVLGENMRIIGDVVGAEKCLLKVKNIPRKREYLVSLCFGQLYERKGDLLLAEKSYKKAVRLDSSTTITWVYLGNFYFRLGKIKKALNVFLKGQTASGDLDELYACIGDCYCALGNYIDAKEYYKKSLGVDEHYKRAKDALVDVEGALNVIEEYAVVCSVAAQVRREKAADSRR